MISKALIFISSLTILFGCGEDYDDPKNEPVSEQFASYRVSNEIDKSKDSFIAFDLEGNSNVYIGGKQFTYDESLKISIAKDRNDNVAWAYTNYSNSQTEIVLNGENVESPIGYNHNLYFINDSLMWLSFDSVQNIKLCVYANSSRCKNLSYIPYEVNKFDDQYQIIAFDIDTKKYVNASYDENLNVIYESFHNEPLLFVSHDVVGTVPASINFGNYRNNADFFSIYYLVRHQNGDPYAFSNDFMGRLTNNLSYRIRSIARIIEKSDQKLLSFYLEGIIEGILERLGNEYLFESKKYSVSRESKIPFAIDNALLWSAMLIASQHVNESMREEIILKASQAYAFYESDWFESDIEYRFPTHPDIDFDGIYLPSNQEHAIAFLSLLLYESTDILDYYSRATQIYNKFKSEVAIGKFFPVWPYWPEKYYSGWEKGEYESINFPSKGPTSNVVADDYIHGDLSLDFLLKYESLSGQVYFGSQRKSIIENLILNDSLFAFFLNADTHYVMPSWDYLPLNNLFPIELNDGWALNNFIVTTNPTYDNQLVFLSYARNIDDQKDSYGLVMRDINDHSKILVEIESNDIQEYIDQITRVLAIP